MPADPTDPAANGVQFPLPAQPVVGFSGVVEGRRHGEYLAMADNGFGSKANSFDFLIRAYWIRPNFKTARGGSGSVDVGGFIQFSDPFRKIGFPIQNETKFGRFLTGADIDPESIQRDHRGHLWVGDEFGPWILHFDRFGRLVEPPISLDGLVSPNNPHLAGTPTTANSRGIEAMAITPDGRELVVVLEGAVVGDDPSTRRVYRYDLRTRTTTRSADYRVEVATHMVADAQAIHGGRLLVIERDGGRGATALFRRVYEIDIRPAGDAPTKREVVDLAAIPDPHHVSLPPIHAGDIGLGDPFQVTCESIEALRVRPHGELLLGCDNNYPNSGRNPTRPDDTELIVVDVDGR
jgi:glycerophosphoryl diester phosphodiesterase